MEPKNFSTESFLTFLMLQYLASYKRVSYEKNTCTVSGIFSHIHNFRHIKPYLPTFGYILVDSRICRALAQLDIFIYIKAYSELMTYSVIFRTVDIFGQFQTLLRSNSCIFWIVFEQIQTYLELWLI